MEFTKEDLKTGMVCLHRSGKYSIVVKDTYENEDNIIFHWNNKTGLGSFDNKTFKWDNFLGRKEKQTPYMKSVDIIKIYKPSCVCDGFIIFNEDKEIIKSEVTSWEILWEENQTVEMTLEEICVALGKNIKITK